jgi:hypothetical protein
MKAIIAAVPKFFLLVILFLTVNAVFDLALPLSFDLIGAIDSQERAMFAPLYLVSVCLTMSVMLITLNALRYRGWKLFLVTFSAFYGLFVVFNQIEVIYLSQLFPRYTPADTVKVMVTAVFTYGLATLLGTWMVNGFEREEGENRASFEGGRYYWKVVLFMAFYHLFYLKFPQGPLMLLSSLPILMGARTRRQAYCLMPLVLVTGTAGSQIPPSPVVSQIVRLLHALEMVIFMSFIGWFMAWLFLKEKKGREEQADNA